MKRKNLMNGSLLNGIVGEMILILFGIIVVLVVGTVLNIIFAVNEPDDDIRDENDSFNENKTKE